MKSWQKIAAGIGALVIMFTSLAACSKENKKSVQTFDALIDSYNDNTLLDEILALNEEFSILEATETQEVDFSESVNKLETYMNIIAEMNELGIEPTEQSSEETIEKYSELTEEEVRELLEIHKSGEKTDIEKLRIKAALGYINQKYRNWIQNNGLEISEELLKKAIKAATCQVSGLEPENYNDCSISSQTQKEVFKPLAVITINDKESQDTLVYEIPYIPHDYVYYYAINTLYDIQSSSETDFDSIFNYCDQALTYVKLMIVSGVVLEDDAIKPYEHITVAKQLILQQNAQSQTETTTTM